MSELQELKKEVSKLKESLNELKSSKENNCNPQTNLEERLIKAEHRTSEQEQCSHRECIKLMGRVNQWRRAGGCCSKNILALLHFCNPLFCRISC